MRAIDLRYLERWSAGRRKPALRQMGVDEIYLGKKTKFVTVVSNLETGEPLWFGKERKQASLDEDEKAELVFAACNRLKIHARLEDELFYPAVRALINDDDLMEEARLEHGTARELIARLETMQPSHPLYDTCFTFLGECINHHIGEEEREIFARARAAGLDAAPLGRELQVRKQQLEGLAATSPRRA